MKTADRIVWSEGMFLAPQHLQRADRYHEAFVAARVAALGRPEWGVLRCKIDQSALSLGQVSIAEFAGVLPDGTPVAFGREGQDGDDPPANRPIDGQLGATQQKLDIYLALKREREGAANVDSDENREVPHGARSGTARSRARYSLARRSALDESAARGEEVEVAFARKNLVILLGQELRDDYDAIKIAELERSSSGALRLAADYVPPCLSIGGSSFIMDGIDELLTLMSSKQRALSAQRRQRSKTTVEFQSRDITFFLQLNALNSSLPVLKHFTAADTWPTEQVYLHLVQLAGQLSTFAGELDPTTLPDYQYDDLRATFGGLFAQIKELLEVAGDPGHIAVPLEQERDNLVGTLDEQVLACGRFILAIRTDRPADEVERKIPEVAKISGESRIESFKRNNVKGVKLVATHNPPEVAIRADTSYFTWTSQDDEWAHAVKERAVAIYLPRPYNTGPGNIQLLALPAKS